MANESITDESRAIKGVGQWPERCDVSFRATIAAGWGAALSLSVDAIGAQGPTWLITAPLATIPSLAFLTRDRLTTNEPLDAPSITAALTAGAGTVAVGKSLAAFIHGVLL